MPRNKLHPTDSRVRDLILWARAERIVLGRISIGDVELDLSDTHLAGKLAEPKVQQTEADAAKDMYRKYGGAVLAQFEQEATAGVSEAERNMQSEEDDQP